MTPKVKKLYKAAKKDIEFIKDIADADNDKPPGLFSDEIEKVIFAGVYYGYLVGKLGIGWDMFLKE